jgi:glycosyltransferase involved in cell wall biosynthesis
MNKKTISFVLPVYNDEEIIPEFHRVLSAAVKQIEGKYNFEFVFVNDGSSDGCGPLLHKIAAADSRAKVIEFSRNFGQQIAITAGLDFATGDAVIFMDTDLQDPPATALELIKEWEKGFEVVYAVRRSRKDTFWKKFFANTFYKLMGMMSEYPIPQNTSDFRLLDKRAAEAVRKYREIGRFMRGIAVHVGFKQKGVLFDRDERTVGETHYSIKKMVRLASDGIIGFSNVPLRFMSVFGLFVSFISIIGIVYVIIVKLFFPHLTIQGWTLTFVAILFIGGVQFVMLGMLGEYIARIYAETKGRPLYIISSLHGFSEK